MTADLNLAPGEAVEWTGSPRITAVLPAVAVGLVLLAFGVVLVAVSEGVGVLLAGVLLFLAGLAIPGLSYLQVVNTEFTVTDRALYRRTGVLSRSVRQVELDRVQDSSFSQHVRGRLFGYGTVTFDVAGGGALRFDRIDGPKGVRQLVDRKRQGRADFPGSLDQWEAILDEVRALRRAVETGR